GEAGEAVLAHRRIEGVDVHGDERHALAADAFELGLDARHRAAPIPVHEEAVHAVLGELLGGGEPEAARSAEDHGPVLRQEPHAATVTASTRSAERTAVIDSADTPIALENPRRGRPGPIATTRDGRVVRASMLWRQRTVLLICRTSRVLSAATSASWKPPVRFEVTDGALAASQCTLAGSRSAAKVGSIGAM